MKKDKLETVKKNYKNKWYYLPQYNGLVFVHDENDKTITIGDVREYISDAKTNIFRYIVSKNLLTNAVRVFRNRKYPFIEINILFGEECKRVTGDSQSLGLSPSYYTKDISNTHRDMQGYSPLMGGQRYSYRRN